MDVRCYYIAQGFVIAGFGYSFSRLNSRIQDLFNEFLKYPNEVSGILTKICTHNGSIIQGALTSSYIASLCLYDVEGHVVKRLERKNLTYTRLVDDITVSSKNKNYNFDYPASVIKEMLTQKDLPLNKSKESVQRVSTEPLYVHGLRVSFKEPRLPSKEVSRIRAAVKNIENLAKEPNYRISFAYRRDYNQCMGRVNKLSRVGHKQHPELVKRLKNVCPLPSQKDIDIFKKVIKKIEKDFHLKSHTYWYWKSFNKAHERLNIIKLKYPKFEAKMRDRLRDLKPNYE